MYLVPKRALKRLLQITCVVDLFYELYQHVNDLCLHCFYDHFCEHLIDHHFVGDVNINYPKSCDDIMVYIVVNLKCRVNGLTFIQIDLIVVWIGVHEYDKLMTQGGVDQLIYS